MGITSLKDVKLVVMGFDDTLAIYKNYDYTNNHNGKKLSLDVYLYWKDYYERCEPCAPAFDMIDLVRYCRNHDIKMLVCSAIKTSIYLKAQQEFVHKHYGYDIEFITADSSDTRVDVLKLLSRVYCVNENNILFIDSDENIRNEVSRIGIVTYEPQNVYTLYTIEGSTLRDYTKSRGEIE